MSTHDVMSLMFQFGLFQFAALTFIVTLVKVMLDNHNKKK